MKKKTKQRIIKFFAAVTLVLVVSGFSVMTTALAVIPNWTQESKLSCFPSESSTEPIPAFVGKLSEEKDK